MSNDNTAKPTEGPWVLFTPGGDDGEERDGRSLGIDTHDGIAVLWYGENEDSGAHNDADVHLFLEAGGRITHRTPFNQYQPGEHHERDKRK